jgi:type VI protein secretion system component Hcp
MMKRAVLCVAVVALLALCCAPLVAADEMKLLMWIDGITGPEDQAASWIECAGFEHNIPGLARPILLLSRMDEYADFSYQASSDPQNRGADLMLTKEVDKSSLALLTACRNGTRMPKMKLAFINTNAGELKTNGMLFEDAILTTYMTRAPGFGDRGNISPLAEGKAVEILGFHVGTADGLGPLLDLMPLLK